MKKKYDTVDVGRDDTKTVERKVTKKPIPSTKDEKSIEMKEYIVDLQEGQVTTIVLKPGQTLTVTYGLDGNIYPEFLRSLVHGNIIKEKEDK